MGLSTSVIDILKDTVVVKNDQVNIPSGSVVALTVNTSAAGMVGALVSVDGLNGNGGIYVREDGVNPDSVTGQLFCVGETFLVWGSTNLTHCKLHAANGVPSNSTVNVVWLQ